MVHFVSYEDYPSAVLQREQASSDTEGLQKPLGLVSTAATYRGEVLHPVSRFRPGHSGCTMGNPKNITNAGVQQLVCRDYGNPAIPNFTACVRIVY